MAAREIRPGKHLKSCGDALGIFFCQRLMMNSFARRSLHLCALFDREKAGMPDKRVK
jgi:hypothetical protein